jgi:hypothetical protein
MTALRVPYFPVEPLLGEAAFMPFLPVTLILGDKKLEASGLLDSGSTVNVLPCSLGEKLGAVFLWLFASAFFVRSCILKLSL